MNNKEKLKTALKYLNNYKINKVAAEVSQECMRNFTQEDFEMNETEDLTVDILIENLINPELFRFEQKEWKKIVDSQDVCAVTQDDLLFIDTIHTYNNLPANIKRNVAYAINFLKFSHNFEDYWNLTPYQVDFNQLVKNLLIIVDKVRNEKEITEEEKDVLDYFYYRPLNFSNYRFPSALDRFYPDRKSFSKMPYDEKIRNAVNFIKNSKLTQFVNEEMKDIYNTMDKKNMNQEEIRDYINEKVINEIIDPELLKIEQKEWNNILNTYPETLNHFELSKESLEEGYDAYVNLSEERKQNIARALNFAKFDYEFKKRWDIPYNDDQQLYGAIAGNIALILQEYDEKGVIDEDLQNFLDVYYYRYQTFPQEKILSKFDS